MRFPIQVPADFTVIAHRGASGYAPENSAAAFRIAHHMGVDDVELDVQLTVDGQLALCHDSSLQRYGYSGQAVEEMEWSELAALDMGSWFSPYFYSETRMWRLDDLFQSYGERFNYHVELKGSKLVLSEAVLDCINRFGLRDYCIVTSFQHELLTIMRELDSDIRLAWLIPTIDDAALSVAEELALTQLCPEAILVDAEQVKRAREVVPGVRAWGINGDSLEIATLIERVVDSGCDGTTINWPDLVTKQL